MRLPAVALMAVTALASPAVLPAATASAAAPQHPAGAGAGAGAGVRVVAEANGYRYWSFWQQKEGGSWSYATQGPATHRPEDGDTLGFRFALSENSQQADKPRGAVAFADACAKTAAEAGSKRVAVRIDFGTRADAAEGEPKAPPAPRTGCARIPEKGTAAEALAEVASPLRYSSEGLLCAIDHYPAKGCGEQAKGSGDSGKGSSDSRKGSGGDGGKSDGSDDGLSTGLGVGAGVAAVAVLGVAALWQARRRRR
ncbi:SCO2322 family protein [Streptomyces smyrnaeus]